jgi:hypothetical protein
MEVYQVDKVGIIRQFQDKSENGIGALRVEAIVNGKLLVDANMDAGSH